MCQDAVENDAISFAWFLALCKGGPETALDAEDSDSAQLPTNCAGVPFGPNYNRALKHDDRTDTLGRPAQRQIPGQSLTEESRSDQRFFDPAELMQGAFAQAAAKR